MVRMVARFGGFLERKRDGHPSPQALWEGLLKLHTFAIGIAAAKQAFIYPG